MEVTVNDYIYSLLCFGYSTLLSLVLFVLFIIFASDLAHYLASKSGMCVLIIDFC